MEPTIDILKSLMTPLGYETIKFDATKEIKNLKPKTVIVDGTNNHPFEYLQWDADKVQDLKYSLTVPNLEDKYEIYIVSPIIFSKIKYLNNFTPIELPPNKISPKIETIATGDQNTTFELFEYVTNNLEKERDIVIYCEDPDELEHIRSVFVNFQDTQVIVLMRDKYFKYLQNLVFKEKSNIKHTIYLLLEAQYIPSKSVSLIIHCQYKYELSIVGDYRVNQKKIEISYQELKLREMCCGENGRIVSNFPYSVHYGIYYKNSIPSFKHNVPDYLSLINSVNLEYKQAFMIIAAILSTPGNLHQRGMITDFFNQRDNPTVWVDIVTYILYHIKGLLMNKLKELDLINWCSARQVNVTKLFMVISFLLEFSDKNKLNDILTLTDNQAFTPKFISPDINLNGILLRYFTDRELEQLQLNKQLSLNKKNISFALLTQLWQTKAHNIQKIECQRNCIIEANIETYEINILCDRTNDINQDLDALIKQYKTELKAQTMPYAFQNGSAMILKEGAEIATWSANHAVNTAQEIKSIQNIGQQFVDYKTGHKIGGIKKIKSINAAAELCEICYDDMTDGYLLESCGHKFCFECLRFSILNNLNDMNQLPLKCGSCQKPLILTDIFLLLGSENLDKLMKLSINKFVAENMLKYQFCYTPGCVSLVNINDKKMDCPTCKKNYCIGCKEPFHVGLTCEQNAKDKSDEGLEKLGIRKCPSCAVMIQKIDGCNRVTCSSCNKSMCWKKHKDTGKPCMLVFATPGECYAHLNAVHGGYWD